MLQRNLTPKIIGREFFFFIRGKKGCTIWNILRLVFITKIDAGFILHYLDIFLLRDGVDYVLNFASPLSPLKILARIIS